MRHTIKTALLALIVFAGLTAPAFAAGNCVDHEPGDGHENWRIGHVKNSDDDFHPDNRFYAGRDERGNSVWKTLDSPDVVKYKHCREAEVVLYRIGGWLYDNVGYEQYD